MRILSPVFVVLFAVWQVTYAQNLHHDFRNVIADPLLINTFYQQPNRLVGNVSSSGAVSVNADWEQGTTPNWFIEQQRRGADLLQAGLVLRDVKLIRQGMLIESWGLKQQAADGSFPKTGDAVHSTSLFLEATGRAILLARAYQHPQLQQIEQHWSPRMIKMAEWINQPEVSEPKRDVNLEPFTHRYFLRGLGLLLASRVARNEQFDQQAIEFVRQGLQQQQADGTLPERNGFDLSYQSLGMNYAGRFYFWTNDKEVQTQIANMLSQSLPIIDDHIDDAGIVRLDDSSRSNETSRSGKAKRFDYFNAVQAYLLAERITSQKRYREIAELLASAYQANQ